jgi:hypothetical protein
MEDTRAVARLQVLNRQLTSGQQPTFAGQSAKQQTSSSYDRVHGEVSRAPTQWVKIPRVAQEYLVDVLYEKSEGIAKVCHNTFRMIIIAFPKATISCTYFLLSGNHK